MDASPRVCEREGCGRMLVTRDALARAVHSGCALTGYLHPLEQCPSRRTFEMDAKQLWGHMRREAEMEGYLGAG